MVWQAGGAGRRWHRNQGLFARVRILNLRTFNVAYTHYNTHIAHSTQHTQCTPQTQRTPFHCHTSQSALPRDTTLSQECSTFTRHNPISRVFHPLTAGHHTNTQTRERADYIRALDADGRLSAAVSWTRLEHPTWWHRRVLRVRADEQAGAPGESGESVVLLATCIFVSTVTLTHLP